MCETILKDEDHPELSQTAKQRPGFTSCLPGCVGWHCSCFFYNPSRLFLRYYALPTSNDIYEVFQYPIWFHRLRINIESGKLKLSTELTSEIKYHLPNTNISITTSALTSPPLQVHGATFISSFGLGSKTPHWTFFTFTPSSAPGTPAKRFTEELSFVEEF